MENFEKVNQHVESSVADPKQDLKGAKLHEIWAIAKPIFNLLSSLPIIPQKWKSILVTLSLTLDSLDPQA